MAADNPKTARVALQVLRDTRRFINTFHAARIDDGTLDASDLILIAGAFADWWDNNYRHMVPSNISGSQVTVTKQDPGDPLQYTDTLTTGGDASGGIDPADVTGALSFRTGYAGRKFRGRYYHFAPPASQINVNDTFQGGFIATVIAQTAALFTYLFNAGYKLILFHKATNTYTAITALVMDQLVDSMRRRLAERGI